MRRLDRSTRQPALRSGGPLHRLGIAVLLALVSLCRGDVAMAEAASAATAPLPLPPARVALATQGDGAVLRIDGVLTPDVPRRIATLLDGLPAGVAVIIDLDSPGGFTDAGYALVDRLLEERARGRRVVTRVASGSICESMCVAVFLAGAERWAAPDAVFMVHAPRGLNSGNVTLSSTTRLVDRMVALGARADWIARVKAAGGFTGRTDYRLTAARLLDERSGIITELTDR